MLRKNGTRYETVFLARNGCSVMFLNDTTFNGWQAGTPGIDPAAVVTPMRKRTLGTWDVDRETLTALLKNAR